MKGKLDNEEEHDEDALLLNEDLDDDLLKDSDAELENELNGADNLSDSELGKNIIRVTPVNTFSNLDLEDKEENKEETVEKEEKAQSNKSESPKNTEPKDELAVDLEEEELDYDDELSDDGSAKVRESKFKSERKDESEPIRTKRYFQSIFYSLALLF